MNEFMTLEVLATFAGLVAAVGIIVQFTKKLITNRFSDVFVRLYTLAISLVLTFVFASAGKGIDNVILTIINAIIVAIASMGAYEVVVDPKAKKE